jgi:hypothetical protein
MQQRLGLLHSMPLISDEITSKNRKDFEWVPGFIFDVSEGLGKDRMESGANKERENTTYWKLDGPACRPTPTWLTILLAHGGTLLTVKSGGCLS